MGKERIYRSNLSLSIPSISKQIIEKRLQIIGRDLNNIFLLLDPSQFNKCLVFVSSIIIAFLPDYVICVLRKKRGDKLGEIVVSNAVFDAYSCFEDKANDAYKKRYDVAIDKLIIDNLSEDLFLKGKCHFGLKSLRTIFLIEGNSYILELIIPYDNIQLIRSIKKLLSSLLRNLIDPPTILKDTESVLEKKYIGPYPKKFLLNGFREFYEYHEKYFEEIVLKLERDLGYQWAYTTPCLEKPPSCFSGNANCSDKSNCRIPLCSEYFKEDKRFFLYYLPDKKREIIEKWIEKRDLVDEDFRNIKELFIQGNKEGAAAVTSETFIPEFVDLKNDPRISFYGKRLLEYEKSDHLLKDFINIRTELEHKFLGKLPYLSAFPIVIKNAYFGMVLIPMQNLTFEENWKINRMMIGRFSNIIEPLLIGYIEKITLDYSEAIAQGDRSRLNKVNEEINASEKTNPHLPFKKMIRPWAERISEAVEGNIEKVNRSKTAEEIAYCTLRCLAHFEGAHVIKEKWDAMLSWVFREVREVIGKDDESRVINEKYKLHTKEILDPIAELFELLRSVLIPLDPLQKVKWYEEWEVSGGLNYDISDYITNLLNQRTFLFPLGWWKEGKPKNIEFSCSPSLKISTRKILIRWLLANMIRNTVKHAAKKQGAKQEGAPFKPANKIYISCVAYEKDQRKYFELKYWDDAKWSPGNGRERINIMKDYMTKPMRGEQGELKIDIKGYALRMTYLLLTRIPENKPPEIIEERKHICQILYFPITL